MMPLSYGTVYRVPEDYKPPEETDLADNTDYPNLNSRDYAKRPLNHTVRMHETWECISISTPDPEPKGNIAICCNKLSGREWTSSLWGFEKTEVVKHKQNAIKPKKACFKLQCSSIINCMEFIAPNMILLAFSTGNVQLWSTYSELRNAANPYCLFLIGEKFEHMKPITALTSFKMNRNKAASASKDGTIKIWDMGTADLVSVNSFRFAHIDTITGLSSLYTRQNLFASCSLDKSCILWDDRETRPAIALYEKHIVRFKDVTWSNDPNFIYVGDESGNVITLDTRQPKRIFNSSKYYDRPIRKILPNGNNLAVITDSNVVKISKSATNSVFYENNDAENFIRDGAWLTTKELLTIGFDGKLRSHDISETTTGGT